MTIRRQRLGLDRRRRVHHLGGDRHASPIPDAAPRNFGWPCREGNGRDPAVRRPRPPAVQQPAVARRTRPSPTTTRHGRRTTTAGPGSSSISGIAFRTTAGNYPTKYDNGLFFADYTRRCIWFAPARARPRPRTSPRSSSSPTCAAPATPGRRGLRGHRPRPATSSTPTTTGRRSGRSTTTRPLPPTAAFTATPTSGPAPLTVDFDASGSSDPNGDPITLQVGLRRRRHVRR